VIHNTLDDTTLRRQEGQWALAGKTAEHNVKQKKILLGDLTLPCLLMEIPRSPLASAA
jgi:hypothetical protein